MMKILIEVIKGVEGHCLAINDMRVSGPKPWGGGTVVHSFTISVADIRKAIPYFNKRRKVKCPCGKSVAGYTLDDVGLCSKCLSTAQELQEQGR